MGIKKINFTVEIEDDIFIEARLIEVLTGILGQSMIDYQILPDTKELYERDTTFQKLIAAYKTAKRERNDYINRKIVEGDIKDINKRIKNDDKNT